MQDFFLCMVSRKFQTLLENTKLTKVYLAEKDLVNIKKLKESRKIYTV